MIGSLHMGWRHLLFANWPVDPDVVAPTLPDGLAVDTYDGQAWLSVVPFTNVDVRPTWIPWSVGLPLPELNLRTYVTHDGNPGVYFYNLDAQGLLGVYGARILHHLPYYYARISLETDGDRVHFTSKRRHAGAPPARFDGTFEPTGDPIDYPPGSRAHFLTERYRYYTETPWGTLRYADIEHDPWTLYRADVDIPENTLFEANGFDRPDTEPVNYYSPAVTTIASPNRRV